MRKVISFIMILSLVMALAAGCATGGNSETTIEDQTTTQPQNDEPVTLRILKPGTINESPENPRIKAKIEEELYEYTGTKVNLDFYFYDWDVFSEKYNLDIVSQNAPDAFRATTNIYFKLAFDGQFQALDSVIDEYIPNLTRRFTEGEIKAGIVNGETMGLPLGGTPANSLMLIRKDKLDLLGKEIPTTLAELEDVYAAYKEAHPDETPYMGYWSANVKWIGALAGLDSYFGTEKSLKSDGTVTTYYMQPNMPRYIELLRKWVENGWCQADVLTAGEEAEGLFIKDKGLTIITYERYGLDFFKQTKESVNPDATAAVVPALTTPWSDTTIAFDGYNSEGYLAVPKTTPADKVKLVAQFVNWELDSPDNWWLTKRGEKGIDYEIIDGKMSTPEKWQAEGAQPYDWTYYLINSVFTNGGDLNTPQIDALPETDTIYNMIRTVKTIKNPLLDTPYLPLDDLATQLDSVTKKLGELQSEIITGQRPLSDWDLAEEIWLDGGGAELEEKMTEVYNSMKP